MRDLLIVLLVALIIIVGGWRFMNYQKQLGAPVDDGSGLVDENATTSPDVVGDETSGEVRIVNDRDVVAPSNNAVPVVSSAASVQVVDQKAGTVVTLPKVVLGADGWIAVRDNSNGKMGNTLGAKFLAAGSYSDLSVNLLRSTEAGKNYFAVVLKDNGDKQYLGAQDLPVTDAQGNAVSATFKVQ